MNEFLILSPVYPYRGGIANFAEMLYKTLSAKGNIKIINFKRQYPSILFPGKTQYEENDKKGDIRSERMLDSINPLNWIKVGKKIKAENPSYLIINYWLPFFAPAFGVISSIAKKNGNTKVVAICHNVLPHEKRPGDKVLTKYFFKHVDYFVTMSDAVQRDLLEIKPSAVNKLLFHPVYSNFGEPVSKEKALKRLNLEEKKTLLFFGFIRAYKGLDVLLKAVSLLKDKMDFKLIVAGEFYANKQEYLKIIKEQELENYIDLHSDFISSSDVKYYFSAADVVVLPYKSATQSGIVQVANNFYKPVIATNVGGLGEIIKDGYNGYIVEPDNPEALAKAIERFFNEADAKVMSENVKKELDKYSWNRFVEELIELIGEGE